MLTAQGLFDLAMQHHREGRLPEAETLYRRLLAQHPREPDVLHMLGVLAANAGNPQAAVDLIGQAIAIKPSAAEYYSNIATPLIALNRLDDAATAAGKAVELQPELAPGHYNLGLARLLQRKWDAAASALETALRLQPENASAYLNLGNVYQSRGHLAEAIATFRDGLARSPRHVALLNNLGNALRLHGDLAGATDAYRAAVQYDPHDPLLLNNLALAMMDAGDSTGAIATLQQSLAMNPQQAETRSNLIFFAHALPDGYALLREELSAWQRIHEEPLRPSWPLYRNNASPDRPLRIGYVSPDLRDHVVGRTLLPIFQAHDRSRFEITCYSEFADVDPITARFKEGAARWRITAGRSDEEVTAQIGEDGIDILVDLALHTSDNRLSVFARKPAPIQVAWLGYPGSTGLHAMDYVITDEKLDPGDLNADYYSERLVRLPGAWCCYPRPDHAPDVCAPPVLAAGYITFGSLNKLSKTNPGVLRLWSRILNLVQDSKLMLLARGETQKQNIRDSFSALGISPHRIGFFDYLPGQGAGQVVYLSRYDRIDIALDSFPYNGMTTTGDALWMGTPVVALVGKLPVSRASFSLLSAVGLPDLAAKDEEEYVRIAVELATDHQRLSSLRTTLRDRMKQSGLLDPVRFAQDLEKAFREMWALWCGQQFRAPAL